VKVRSKATTTLLVTLVMALVVMGIAYAKWDKELFIQGTVNTGTLDVVFANVECSDLGIDPGYDKDVGSCSVCLSDEDETMTVTINNAYPCYSCTIDFDLVNVGTIPVIIESVTIDNPNSNELTVTMTPSPDDLLGVQIDPDGSVHVSLYVHVEQPAEQGSSYSFTITIVVVQWNEYGGS